MNNNEKYELSKEYLSVITSNDFINNHIPGLNVMEYNILQALMGKIKKHGIEEVSVSFEELRIVLDRDELEYNKVAGAVESLWEKVKLVDYSLMLEDKETGIEAERTFLMLFSYMKVTRKDRNVKLSINPALAYLVNDFEQGRYTATKLKNIVSLGSTYSKRLHILLSQFKSTGFYKVKAEQLRKLMDCPSSYRTADFHSKVLEPALKEVDCYFNYLEYEKIHIGRRVDSYEFRFEFIPEPKVEHQTDYQEFIKREGSQSVKEVGPRAKSKKSKAKSTKKSPSNKSRENKLDPNAPSGVDGLTNSELENELKGIYLTNH